MAIGNSLRARLTFAAKAAVTIALVALADILFFDKEPGSTMGVFALAWVGLMALALPAIRSSKFALAALGLAGVMGLVLVEAPGPLPVILFWITLSSSALLPRREAVDAAQLALRLALHGFLGLGTPVRDASRLAKIPRPGLRSSLLSVIAALWLPLTGGLVFILLFAQANPVVARLLPDMSFAFLGGLRPGRLVFWAFLLLAIWPSLRPSKIAVGGRLPWKIPAITLPGVTQASVTASLLLFNLLFAVENLLDIAFLWSGAPLPGGVTMADYAHRGAYPLIATALLAGGFVLMTARPETAIGQNPLIRRLVVLWTAQNLILVVSSIIRTLDYIDAYMLTRLRVAALIWMGLVATGLILICWRMMMRHSLSWLINTVAASALTVLVLVSMVDLGSIAAKWNVRHAREAGGAGQALDLGYLRGLGPSALVALAELETQPLHPQFRDRVTYVRKKIQNRMIANQKMPHGWIWRDARRLAEADAILGASRDRTIRPGERERDGSLVTPPPAFPLTPPAGQ